MKGQIRIIGGAWRGRRLKVPDVKDLRPTPDRVRETLFNWLTNVIVGARCLDLYAGTGALGLEALSRGAQSVNMVDQSEVVIAALREKVTLLAADERARVTRAKIPQQLPTPREPYDIVFIDPPYAADLTSATSEYLETHGFLAPLAYVYLEADHLIEDNVLPCNWRILKSGRAGQVYYHLALREQNKA